MRSNLLVENPIRSVPRARRLRSAFAIVIFALAALAHPVDAQDEPPEALLVPEAVSTIDIEMRGRYAWEWKDDDGALVLIYTGTFQLEMGRRRLSANNAVVWITPRIDDDTARKFYELVVYLSEDAQVDEPGGSSTQDDVLLVSNLRTFGSIYKLQDASAQERVDHSPLYQQALRDRAIVEAGILPDAQPTDVTRPLEVRRPRTQRRPRVVRYDLKNIESAETSEGQPVVVATGGVYFSQDGGSNAPFLEIRAENAVVFPAGRTAASLLSPDGAPPEGQPAAPTVAPESGAPPASAPADGADRTGQPGLFSTEALQERVRAVYLEGDVVLSAGTRFIRANRLYYDFELDRALILDGVFRTDIPERNIPLYVRAEEIRQLSASEFTAERARVTTSEFFSPHYHVGVERVYVRDVTQRDTGGRATSPLSGEYELKNATLNVGGVPVLWWPYSKGRLEQTETLLRRFRTGYDGDFGYVVQTAWHLFGLLGVTPPPGYDATLRLDYFSDRGPAVGINADYETESRFGLLRSYLLSDSGVDSQIGPLRRSQWEPESTTRGRILWRHREYLPNNWEAQLELSYISDPNFLEIWERSEFQEGKEQETAIFLKRAVGVEAITLLANWRLLDYLTQTEHLPDLVYRRIGDTLAGTPLAFYHESRIGTVRYRPDDRRFFDRRPFTNDGLTDVTFRADGREEVEAPLKLGPVNVVPFATARGSYWDGAPLRDGALWRGFGLYGVRAASTLYRVYDDVQSQLFDVNRIRHIIQPSFVGWFAHSNVRSDQITPFDEGIETIEDFVGGKIGLRQVWQTKRGAADKQRTVDLVTLNLEAGVFGDAQHGEFSNGYANTFRPEDSRSRNYVAGDLLWRISDTTSFLYEFNFDLNDGSYDRHNLAFAFERNPRLAYILGYRYAGDINMNLVGGGWNYKLNEKHITAFRIWHDIDEGDLGEVAVAYIRKLPRWYAGINFEYDAVDDDYSVSFSMWPEGLPEWTLGSRRFTGLTTSTGIRP